MERTHYEVRQLREIAAPLVTSLTAGAVTS